MTRIYGGTSEVMKSIISKSLGLLPRREGATRAYRRTVRSGHRRCVRPRLRTARLLVERGANVVLVDLPSSAGKEAAERLGSSASFVAADVTDTDGVQAALDAAEENGPLRAVVHCAGRGGDRLRIIDRQRTPGDLDAFAEVVRVNLIGTYNVLRLAAARMSGNELLDGDRGAMVLTASVAAFDGQIGQTSYTAAKAGVHGITLVAARDLASWQIRVNTIAPGIFEPPCSPSCAKTSGTAWRRPCRTPGAWATPPTTPTSP